MAQRNSVRAKDLTQIVEHIYPVEEAEFDAQIS